MPIKDDLAEQRDRFMAFAFASSDVLLEIGPEGRVAWSSGALRQMTGVDGAEIRDAAWIELFSDLDRQVLKNMEKTAVPGRRCGPVAVTMRGLGGGPASRVLLTAIRLPDKKNFYVALEFPNLLAYRLGREGRDNEEGRLLLDKDDFVKSSRAAMKLAKDIGQDIDMTLLDLPDLQGLKKNLPEGQWDQTMDLVANILKGVSVDGKSVTRLTDMRYGILHDKKVSAQTIEARIKELLKQTDPPGADVGVQSRSIAVNPDTLTEREAARAVMYTLKEFEKSGTELTVQKLDDSFKLFLAENTKKIKAFKTIISGLDFNLFFQPVVNLANLRLSHYEMLARFKDGAPPYEWVTFGEDVGLAIDFDLAVCTRALRYIQAMPPGNADRFAVNVSGLSVTNENFTQALLKQINADKSLKGRMIFEITESANISDDDLDKVNHFVLALQKDGFEACLDDFGAGSASFQYLHKLHVDHLKLDGAYVRHIMEDKRDQVMVRNLVRLCKDLDVTIVAEHIETIQEADLLHGMEVGYGQGYFFSKPTAAPDYKVDEKKVTGLQGIRAYNASLKTGTS